MTSISVIAPYAIALVTPTLGLKFGMATFIAGGALLLIAISLFDTSRWMPRGEEAEGNTEADAARNETAAPMLAAGNAAR
ncbi:MAG TPA: hypothetical protein VG320_07610 [Paraburkholderia sp.]|jgi:SHS family lactate transporter-like MFS transporter|uniref:hypothetical protein n=1 Tax=Paraburkholderia sp. TaxID=1926495 RepID=UPI002DE44C23|nr:hypothetical protein [Paraburkholderia sp.]